MASTAGESVVVTVGEPVGKSLLDLGITYTKPTLRPNANPAAVEQAKSIIARVAHYQNLHIMGWGTPNPEISPGVFDWTSLDRRMAIVRETGGTPVITLCCAPDWMKGGTAGQTDWKQLTVAPLPEHFKDFAELARQIALRYPEVKYYQVWNEFKGFWNHSAQRWDYEGYTALYNVVYDTLKSVSPDIKVGGPYTPMGHSTSPDRDGPSPISGPYGAVKRGVTDAFRYWLAHKHGADFVTIDGHVGAKDGLPVDLFSTLQFYSDIDTWIRQQTPLPIWWAEWYSTPDLAEPASDVIRHAHQNALMTATLITMAPAVSVALRWGPESDDQPPYVEGDQEGMWTSTHDAAGGQPLPFAASAADFERCFPRNAVLLATHVSSNSILAMAGTHCVLVVNKTAQPVNVIFGGAVTALDPYGVAYLPRD
jgi:hypothetical protein